MYSKEINSSFIPNLPPLSVPESESSTSENVITEISLKSIEESASISTLTHNKERTDNEKQINYFLILPQELIFHIFCNLGFQQLCVVARVCKLWYCISNDNGLWKYLYDTRFGALADITATFNYKAEYKEEILNPYTLLRPVQVIISEMILPTLETDDLSSIPLDRLELEIYRQFSQNRIKAGFCKLERLGKNVPPELKDKDLMECALDFCCSIAKQMSLKKVISIDIDHDAVNDEWKEFFGNSPVAKYLREACAGVLIKTHLQENMWAYTFGREMFLSMLGKLEVERRMEKIFASLRA